MLIGTNRSARPSAICARTDVGSAMLPDDLAVYERRSSIGSRLAQNGGAKPAGALVDLGQDRRQHRLSCRGAATVQYGRFTARNREAPASLLPPSLGPATQLRCQRSPAAQRDSSMRKLHERIAVRALLLARPLAMPPTCSKRGHRNRARRAPCRRRHEGRRYASR